MGYPFTVADNDDLEGLAERYGLGAIEGASDMTLSIDPEWSALVDAERRRRGIGLIALHKWLGCGYGTLANALTGKVSKSEIAHKLSLAFDIALPWKARAELMVEEWSELNPEVLRPLVESLEHMKRYREAQAQDRDEAFPRPKKPKSE
jgi:hypothetical protein